MSKYKAIVPIAGTPHMDATMVPDTTQRFPMGAIIPAVDPYWGGAEFMYVYFAGTVRVKGLVVVLPVYDATLARWRFEATEAPSTTIMGQMLGVAVAAAVATKYGWVQISGLTPVNCNAAVAADTTFSIAAAGQGGAAAAGKQVVSARIVGASTITKVKASKGGVIGASTFAVADTDGVFLGCYASGTGVGAAAIVTAIDVDERTVTVSVVNSAAVTGNVTFTYNNATIFYNVALLARPFAQGAIT